MHTDVFPFLISPNPLDPIGRRRRRRSCLLSSIRSCHCYYHCTATATLLLHLQEPCAATNTDRAEAGQILPTPRKFLTHCEHPPHHFVLCLVPVSSHDLLRGVHQFQSDGKCLLNVPAIEGFHNVCSTREVIDALLMMGNCRRIGNHPT